MTDVYNAFTTAQKSQTLFTAVDFSTSGTGFCKGAFPAIHSSEWYYSTGWAINQRDVVVLYDNCGTWQVHCKFSMNTYTGDLNNVVTAAREKAAISCPATTPTDCGKTSGERSNGIERNHFRAV